jgi:large subunit ribosomal protein L54
MPSSALLARARLASARRLAVRAYAVKPAVVSPGAASSSGPSRPRAPTPARTDSAPAPRSACAENTALPGLAWLKGQPEVVARPDDEYPAWLWALLTPKRLADDGPGSPAEHARRKRDGRQKIRDANFMKTQ